VVKCVDTPGKYSFTNITYFDADKYSVRKLPTKVDWRDKGVITSVKNQVGLLKTLIDFFPFILCPLAPLHLNRILLSHPGVLVIGCIELMFGST